MLALEKEQEELKGAEASVAALRRQLNTIRENCAALDAEIEQYRIVASNLRHGIKQPPILFRFLLISLRR